MTAAALNSFFEYSVPRMRHIAALLVILFFPLAVSAQEPAQTPPMAPPTQSPGETEPQPAAVQEPVNSFSFVRYRANYEVKADATSVETNEYEVLIKTKAGVDNWSQVRLSYSEKMDTLEVLTAYTLTPDGTRHDVPADKIYTQESYSSASAAMYADRKVKVIVFPNLSPGTRLVYSYRQSQNIPYFPGYFGLWENLSLFTQYDDAKITLTAPKSLPMHLYTRGVQGSDRPRIEGDIARWSWSYSRKYRCRTRTGPPPAGNTAPRSWPAPMPISLQWAAPTNSKAPKRRRSRPP